MEVWIFINKMLKLNDFFIYTNKQCIISLESPPICWVRKTGKNNCFLQLKHGHVTTAIEIWGIYFLVQLAVAVARGTSWSREHAIVYPIVMLRILFIKITRILYYF